MTAVLCALPTALVTATIATGIAATVWAAWAVATGREDWHVLLGIDQLAVGDRVTIPTGAVGIVQRIGAGPHRQYSIRVPADGPVNAVPAYSAWELHREGAR